MMSPPDDKSGEMLRQWLAKAQEDLDVAERLIATGEDYHATIAFHCQQAAEKFLKSYLVRHGIEFPKTHDLDTLLDLVAPSDSELSGSLRDVILLNQYAVDARYPTDAPELTEREARHSIELALPLPHKFFWTFSPGRCTHRA